MTSEPRRERKVITVLFADLVGFTSRAEQLDPEDVEAILRPYHERLRYELERWGGAAAVRGVCERHPRGRDDVPRDGGDDRLQGASRGRGEGEGNANSSPGGRAGKSAFRRRPHARRRHAARRPAERG